MVTSIRRVRLRSTTVGLPFSWYCFNYDLYRLEIFTSTRPAGQQHRAKVLDKRVRSQGDDVTGGGLLQAVLWSEGTKDDGDHV